ncbi:hypothetical protein [Nocardioides nanhaiensis]|uniref:DUF4232 domain-containing protein n=1 Tax=Nocardioides nanhaiensis TaxID=1476871 RepID=A0ABP8WA28_9ACTN
MPATPPTTRGPLPPGVYWRRRLFVLGLACSLVVLIGGLLRGGSDGASEDRGVEAVQSAAEPSDLPSEGPTDDLADPDQSAGLGATSVPTPTPTPLAQPEGACEPVDVAVTPVVEEAVAGRDVTVVLELRSIESAACTYEISPAHVAVTITSGADPIWSSRDCPRVLPTQSAVLRPEEPVRVGVVWNARRSNLGCPGRSSYALDGFYHVQAAALGGEPQDVQFELELPRPDVVTPTPTPTQKPQPSGKPSGKPTGGASGEPSNEPSDRPSGKPAGKPSGKPSGRPTGAVEPGDPA